MYLTASPKSLFGNFPQQKRQARRSEGAAGSVEE
jgi:hypothetical protein